MSSFEIIRGSSKTLECPITDQAGANVDLTVAGTVLTLDVGRALDTPEAQLILTRTMTVKTGTTNVAKYALVPADTASLPYGRYRAEVRAVFQDGTVLRTTQPFDFEITRGVRR